MNEKNEKPPFQKKPGRTLLIKQLTSDNIEILFESLDGLISTYKTEKSSSYFLTFDNIENSTNALESLKNHTEKLKVKYAHYRVFFTMKGLEEDSDYNIVKTLHTDYIKNNTSGNVLYYKLYRKNNSFLDCGDLTVDTKECFDSLMNDENEGFRNYSLEQNLSGSHFRYKKIEQQSH